MPKKELTKLVKRLVGGDSLNKELKGAMIDFIAKDFDNGIVTIALQDGRVIGIMGTGVLVFVSKAAYVEYADHVVADMKADEAKLIN